MKTTIQNLKLFILSRQFLAIFLLLNFSLLISCKKSAIRTSADPNSITPTPTIKMDMVQTLSEGAQRNTIAFDALSLMTNNLGAQTFFPPGKVSDFSGFQYFRDNDPTDMGHNTSFLTIVANNVLSILTDQQRQLFIKKAAEHAILINNYGYMRFPLCKAIRRLMENDLPQGKTMLDPDSVKAYSSRLYQLDGEISYDRAAIFGQIIRSLSSEQVAKLNALKVIQGVGKWNSAVQDPLTGLNLSHDVKVGVMTFASEMYAWYAGDITSDTYFCPERQGTYFGGFYLKDWPAMGNPNYSINEQLTATAGEDFLNVLNTDQQRLMTDLVTQEKSSLLSIVDDRQNISTQLRKFLTGETPSRSTVLSLCSGYGLHDGEIIYLFATRFAQVYQSLSQVQKDRLKAIVNNLGYIDPQGAFLYSQSVAMPAVIVSDNFFK